MNIFAELANWFFLLLAISAGAGMILIKDLKWNLVAFAVQYLGVFYFIQLDWPIRLALIKLLGGLTSGLILYLSSRSVVANPKGDLAWPQGIFFRLLGLGLITMMATALTPQLLNWLGLSHYFGVWVGIFLMGLGLFQVGITSHPLRVIISILIILAGFEIIYAFVETSILVSLMLVTINLGLAFVGGYLLSPANIGSQ